MGGVRQDSPHHLRVSRARRWARDPVRAARELRSWSGRIQIEDELLPDAGQGWRAVPTEGESSRGTVTKLPLRRPRPSIMRSSQRRGPSPATGSGPSPSAQITSMTRSTRNAMCSLRPSCSTGSTTKRVSGWSFRGGSPNRLRRSNTTTGVPRPSMRPRNEAGASEAARSAERRGGRRIRRVDPSGSRGGVPRTKKASPGR